MNYIKFPVIIQFGQKFIGDGLLFSEGENWKKKRKILNQVFNFNFIKSQYPRIIHYCQSTLDEMEADAIRDGNSFEYSVNKFAVSFSVKAIFGGFLGEAAEK